MSYHPSLEQMRDESNAVIQRRLEAWEEELATNRHGMAEVAQRAIDLLRRELEMRSAARKARA